jgi:NAD(P)H dehydrogenase (quinone)
MGKVLVLYDSSTGNTEKMAYLVAEGAKRVEGIEVRVKKVDDATKEDVLWADGLAVVLNSCHLPFKSVKS